MIDSAALEPLEKRFLLRSGEFIGAFRHIGADDHDTIRIELIGDEAVKTSEIEGEILNRDSVQSPGCSAKASTASRAA